jgi:NAD(P)-dependent dehydrogenase (short-subunit alcohol dehydrogenase family)
VDAPIKVAIVTGAGSGIGRAVAGGLLDDGYTVLLAGRRQEALDEVVRDAGPASARAIAVPTDVSDETSVHALFEIARERFGRVDLLFNNAGTNAPALPIDELTPGQWRAVIDVNLTGAFLCTREAVGLMKRQSPRGGRIINNGSVSAYVPRPHSAAYAASKHAITGLTKATSLDGRAFDIACGQIDIGNTATAMAQSQASGVLQPDGEVRIEPLFDVGHVVRAVRYMAGLPLEANVQFMTVMATKMPYIGRG